MTRRLALAWHGLLLAATFARRELQPDRRAVTRAVGFGAVLLWLGRRR